MLPVNTQLPQIPLLQLPPPVLALAGIAEQGCLQRMSRPGSPAALPAHSFAFHLWPLPPIFSLVSQAEADRSCLLALGVTLATSEPWDRSLSQSQVEGGHPSHPGQPSQRNPAADLPGLQVC